MLHEFVMTVLWILLVMVVVSLALTGGTAWWVVRSRRRRNRFGPHDRITAPLHWLYVPGEGPQLHRRLLHAVEAARRSATAIEGRRLEPGGLLELVNDLEEQAGAVDDGVIAASALPLEPRREAYQQLWPTVLEVEALADRLVRLSTQWPAGHQAAVAVARLHDRLDVIEDATKEVAVLERQWLTR